MVKYDDEGSLLRPLRALSFLTKPAITEPLVPRPAAEGYRGFHLNEHQRCVGCSSCQKICDNAAITMIEVSELANDKLNGIRNLRPAIDYGRCCWCALCVDICPTGSLSLSKEYVHTCTQEDIDSYFMMPGEVGMHGTFVGKGWQKSETSDLLDLQRKPMGERPAAQRIDSFDEIVNGFSAQQAEAEASRCVQCGMCHDACPTGMDAPEYIRSIFEGELEQAVRWIYQTNPFSHVCGRVCTHRCEDACSIGVRGTPLAIRWLKRYAMDHVSHQRVLQITQEQKPSHLSARKIAVVGAGPAGLTAAWDLSRMGHQVVVFEARKNPGGMPRYGIPEYRLPYEMLDRDIEVITAMGVEIRCGVEIGSEITVDQLHQEYDAVVLAIGLHLGRSTRIPGSDHEHVKKAVDLLRQVTDEGSIEVPREVVVIGGGNVAMDIARTVARMQKQQWGEVRTVVTALEDQENFLADPEEVREAAEEGVLICPSRGPQACVIENGQLQSLKTWGVCSIFDESGRFAPHFDENDEQCHAAGMVIEAIGQMADSEILLGDEITERLEWNRGRLQIDENCRTSESWLWAAGDCVNGPDVVHAVADGHRVASSIDEVLKHA